MLASLWLSKISPADGRGSEQRPADLRAEKCEGYKSLIDLSLLDSSIVVSWANLRATPWGIALKVVDEWVLHKLKYFNCWLGLWNTLNCKLPLLDH